MSIFYFSFAIFCFILLWMRRQALLRFTSKKILLKTRDSFEDVWVVEEGYYRSLYFSSPYAHPQTSCHIGQIRHVVFAYQKMILMLTLARPTPKRIAIVGLGGGTLSMHLRYLYPKAHLTHIEINPRMKDYAKKFFFFQEDARMTFFFEDAITFFERPVQESDQYDLIILDAFDHLSVPLRFLHRGFYQNLRGYLSKEGVIIANSCEYTSWKKREELLYTHIFSYVKICSPINKKEGNRIIIASKIQNPYSDLESIKEKIQNIHYLLEYMHMKDSFWTEWLLKSIKEAT